MVVELGHRGAVRQIWRGSNGPRRGAGESGLSLEGGRSSGCG